jgi:hypothetical protein
MEVNYQLHARTALLQGKVTVINFIGDWLDNKASVYTRWRRGKSLPLSGIEPQTSVPYSFNILAKLSWIIKINFAEIEKQNSLLEEFRKC